MVLIKRYLIPVMLIALLLAGCDNGPFAPRGIQDGASINGLSPTALARRAFFTGRDSFGVAFQSHVSNAALALNDEDTTVSGWGNATHLGRMTVDQTLDYNSDTDSIWGMFSFQNTKGQYVAGTYRAATQERDPGVLEFTGKFWTEDYNISAVHTEQDSGWGSISGTANFNQQMISFRMNGWLLHFTRSTLEESSH